MGNLLPTSYVLCGHYFPPVLGTKSELSGVRTSFRTSCCPSSAIAAPPRGSFRPACSGELIRGFGKNGGGSYAGRRRSDGDGSWGRRERIELGYRSGVAGDAGIGVGVRASSAAVVKGNTDAGNRVAVLVDDEDGEALGQLRSGRSGLIIAAGDGDVGGG